MAYGNWGAFVFQDGKHQPQWEDNTPYKETELQAGYWQAFRNDSETHPHHAILGKDRMRVCAYKNYLVLFLDGKQIDTSTYLPTEDYNAWESLYQGEIEGYKFRAQMFNGNMIDLELVEPDGTHWVARCGYCYGSGHMDDSDAEGEYASYD